VTPLLPDGESVWQFSLAFQSHFAQVGQLSEWGAVTKGSRSARGVKVATAAKSRPKE
jgi:hypothetical protein